MGSKQKDTYKFDAVGKIDSIRLMDRLTLERAFAQCHEDLAHAHSDIQKLKENNRSYEKRIDEVVKQSIQLKKLLNDHGISFEPHRSKYSTRTAKETATA